MKSWFLGGFVGALALLTLSNFWLQHQFYVDLQDAGAKEAGRMGHQLAVCRQNLEDSLSELRAARADFRECSQGGDVVDRCASERDEVRAERDGLAHALRECHENARTPGGRGGGGGEDEQDFGRATSCASALELAIYELKRIRRTAHRRALDSEASSARLITGSRVVAMRMESVRRAVERHVDMVDAQVSAALKALAEQVVEAVGDIKSLSDPSQVQMYLQKKFKVAMRHPLPEGEGALPEAAGLPDHETRPSTTHRWTAPPTAATLRKSRHSLSKNPLSSNRFGNSEVLDLALPAAAVDAAEPAPVNQAPGSCVAAVVPFRGRDTHLGAFYDHISRFLLLPEAAQLCWTFYIVEQYDTGLFNRGWLFNVGLAMAALEARPLRCIVIQDLDTLPELGAGVDFSDCAIPTQLSSEIECYNWLPPYADNTGGVVSLSGEHWHMVNGFSNTYEGWGGEDDDLRIRLQNTGLLRGTCGSFCNYTQLGFARFHGDLIHRPQRGRGRFICLDEKSHTPRKHGDITSMRKRLRDMQRGSDVWTVDGLSALKFDLIRHEHRPFPGPNGNATLHWLKVVQDAGIHFSPDRVRFVLDSSACTERCRSERRCASFPSQLPFSLAELRAEVRSAFGDCLDGDVGSMGYWLIDRQLVSTSLQCPTGAGGWRGCGRRARSQASWLLSETLREALDSPVNGEPALVVRIVQIPRLRAALSGLRGDPTRQQLPLVSVCVGIYQLEPSIGAKYTVNVGSDDCEQRSWTHFGSFQALRYPRSPTDAPVCIGEAHGTWTMRVSLRENCSGVHLGITWVHKHVFYISEAARGEEICVRYKIESGHQSKWSRYQMVSKKKGRCGQKWDGFRTSFVFRSMDDQYRPLRVYLCAQADDNHRLRLHLDCDPAALHAPGYAVLRTRAGDASDETYCVGRAQGSIDDGIWRGGNCTRFRHGVEWAHVATFTVPNNATGRAWCVGKALLAGSASKDPLRFLVQPQEACSDGNYSHSLGFREVALEDMSEDDGLLSLKHM